MAKKMSVAELVKVIVVAFGRLYVLPDENFGRMVSKVASDADLKTQKESIMLDGIVYALRPIDVTDGEKDEIDSEISRREVVMADLAAELKKPDLKQADRVLKTALLEVYEFYWTDGKGKLIKPDLRQLTGNQRYSVYPEAMAQRLVTIRANGYDSAKGTWPAVQGIDPAKVTAAMVCQQDFMVNYRQGPLTEDEIEDIQLGENRGDFGLARITTLDIAANVYRRWARSGREWTEAEVQRVAKVKRGVAQHIHRICTVAWRLRDTDYDVFGRLMLDSDDPQYRNPLIWASPSPNPANAKGTVSILARMEPAKLQLLNIARKSNGEPPLTAATTDDLIDWIEDCHNRAQAGDTPDKPLSWEDAATTIASNRLIAGYIAACRKGKPAVDAWLGEHKRLLASVERLAAESMKSTVETETDESDDDEVESLGKDTANADVESTAAHV